MERKKLIFWTGASLIILGFVFQIGETWYFGWNLRPESMEEAWCDMVAAAMRYAGILAITYAAWIMTTEMRHTVVAVMGRGANDEPRA